MQPPLTALRSLFKHPCLPLRLLSVATLAATHHSWALVDTKRACHEFANHGPRKKSTREDEHRFFAAFHDAFEEERKQRMTKHHPLVQDQGTLEALGLYPLAEGCANRLKVKHIPTLKSLLFFSLLNASDNLDWIKERQKRIEALGSDSNKKAMGYLNQAATQIDVIIRTGVLPYYANTLGYPEPEYEVLQYLQSAFEENRRIPASFDRYIRPVHDQNEKDPNEFHKAAFEMHHLRFSTIELTLWEFLSSLGTHWTIYYAPLLSWAFGWLTYPLSGTKPSLYPTYITKGGGDQIDQIKNTALYQTGAWVMERLDDFANLVLAQDQTYFRTLYDTATPYTAGRLVYNLAALSQLYLAPYQSLVYLYAKLFSLLRYYKLLLESANYLTGLLHNLADAAKIMERTVALLEQDETLKNQFALYLSPIKSFLESEETEYLDEILQHIDSLPRKEITPWEVATWSSIPTILLGYYNLLNEISEEEHLAFKRAIYALLCIFLEAACAQQIAAHKAHPTEHGVTIAQFSEGLRPNITGSNLYIALGGGSFSLPNDTNLKASKTLIQGKEGSGKSTLLKTYVFNLILAQSTGFVQGDTTHIVPASGVFYRNGTSSTRTDLQNMKDALNFASTAKRTLICYDRPFHATYAPEGEALALISLNEMTKNSYASTITCSNFLNIKETVDKMNFSDFYFVAVERFKSRSGTSSGPNALEIAVELFPPYLVDQVKKLLKQQKSYPYRRAL